MIIPIPNFLRPSFYSANKVAVSTPHCKEKDDLSRSYRYRVTGIYGTDEDEESYDSKVHCEDKDSRLSQIRKQQQQQVVVPAVEVVAADVRGNHDVIEVIHSVNSIANEMRRTQRVHFIDEMFSMNSHIVTDTHYRPETSEEEKTLLYYSSDDYDQFAIEDWRWKVSKEIKRLQMLQVQDQEEEPLKNGENTTDPPISRVRTHHDLARENRFVL